MAKRFNPPPNWPQPPAGWKPKPGWQPKERWGPAPEGWQLWVDDDDDDGYGDSGYGESAQSPAPPPPRSQAAAPPPPPPPPPAPWVQAPAPPPAPSSAGKNWFARHKVLTGIGVVLLLIIFGSASGGGDSEDSPTAADSGSETSEQQAGTDQPEEQSEEEPEPAPEPAIETTSQEMISLLEGNALAAKNTYEDQRVTVSGYVGSIDASGDYFALDPEPDAIIFTGVQVQTDEDFADQVAGLSKGQPVTVTGTVTSVGEVMGYSLEAESIQ